ncbi:MAG: FtsX-like permease family protein [Acutalibacteraceae bacterium]
MKNAFRKDFFRLIWQTRSRFLAIMAIVALGVGFFAGLESAAPNMRRTVDAYLDEYHTMDLRVISPLGLVDDDIDAIRQTEGVAAVLPAYSVDAVINLTGKDEVVRVHSLPQDASDMNEDFVNRMVLTEGRMPQAENECLFYAGKLKIDGKNIGDTITLQESDSVNEAVSCREYTIVGLVNTPYYLSFSLGSTSIGSGSLGYYMYIPQSNFKLNYYSEAFVTVSGAAELDAFSQEYQEAVQEVSDRLTELATLRLEKRRDDLFADQLAELENAKQQYADGKEEAEREIAAAEQKLQDAEAEIDANEKKLSAAEEQLAQGEEQLAAAGEQLAQFRKLYLQAKANAEEQQKTVAALQREWDAAARTYAEKKAAADAELLPKQAALLQAQAVLAQTQAQLQTVNAQIAQTEQTVARLEQQAASLKAQLETEKDLEVVADLSAQLTKTENSLAAAKLSLSAQQQTQQTLTGILPAQQQAVKNAQQEYDDAKRQSAPLKSERQQLDLLGEQLAEAKSRAAELNAAEKGALSQVTLTESGLESSRRTLLTSKQELADGRAKLDTGKAELTAGKQQLESKRSEARQQLDDARMKIAEGEAQLREMTKTSWYLLNRDTNVGFASFRGDADRMASIANVFPVIFFLVAALVALTTMTRMIEEERSLIGTFRALGFSKRKVTGRYLLYAALATFVGSVAGVLLLEKALPVICWNCYRILYAAPGTDAPYQWNYALTGTLAACACTLLATFSACRATVSESPAQLMQPRAPKPGKRILLERIPLIWNHIGFIKKVTARNLFRYKKRLIMTVVGIAGCTGLLLTGFGIKDSVSSIISNQYDEIFQYDMQMALRQETLLDSTREILEDQTKFTDYLEVSRRSTELTMNGATMTAFVSVPKDSAKLSRFITLRSRSGHSPVEFGTNSVVVTEKLANRLGLSVGSSITLKNDDGGEASFTVTGITENYINHYIYISRELYEEKLGAVTFNEIDAICASEDSAVRDDICEELRGRSDVSTAAFSKEFSSQFDTMIESLNYIILIIIVCAGLLAFIVLYNLTNINVSERQREIATIKVLGFYDREVGAYVYRETAMLTIIGCLFGLLLGVVLHRFVITTVEVDLVMFGRTIAPLSFLWSALITAVFAVIVNLVMSKRLQKISMVESLKSVD